MPVCSILHLCSDVDTDPRVYPQYNVYCQSLLGSTPFQDQTVPKTPKNISIKYNLRTAAWSCIVSKLTSWGPDWEHRQKALFSTQTQPRMHIMYCIVLNTLHYIIQLTMWWEIKHRVWVCACKRRSSNHSLFTVKVDNGHVSPQNQTCSVRCPFWAFVNFALFVLDGYCSLIIWSRKDILYIRWNWVYEKKKRRGNHPSFVY